MSNDKHYSPQQIEQKWYDYWMQKGYFNSQPNEKEAYTIVIPPPNVTGVLHMGHLLNNTIQDALIRKARMEGKNACWVPGTDHASIATEAKVVKMLAEKGISKKDITRNEFLNHAWDWKEKYGGIILEQLKKLGASCDWNRTRFTMEESLSEAVSDCFIEMYKDGLIYRGTKMVNWDPNGLTTLSDEEVIYKENNAQLYYVLYHFVDETININGINGLTVATTRPETIMGDVAICVNPNDDRYKHLLGKKVFVPLIKREIPIISDEYIDIEFGTGCLKVTPAHDENDYKIGEKHSLEVIDVLTEDGKISEKGQIYIGLDRFECRKKIVKDLTECYQIVKTEQIKNTIGHSERTDSVIEKRISTQWFVDMKKFMDKHPEILSSVMNDEIKFYPSKYKNVYKHWLDNIKDWNISRQLWWGHRIPAWYDKHGNMVVAKTEEEARLLFNGLNLNPSSKEKDLNSIELTQDNDVLDTWFSSWLWPISVFDGFKENKEELNYYYPTNDLVTGPDIIFFWVARMIMAGYYFKNKKPFSTVYFTGIVRDKQRRKMSKSLGNSPDLLELIDKYGADSVRMGLLMSSPAGNDILYDETLVEQGRNFCNKLWNAQKLILSWQTTEDFNLDTELIKSYQVADKWFLQRYENTLFKIQELYKEYKFSEILTLIYKLIWDDFCSCYLEMIKPAFGQSISNGILEKTKIHFKKLMAVLHPFMPFITEEIYQNLKSENEKDLVVSDYPIIDNITPHQDSSIDLISEVRNIRNMHQISIKEKLDLYISSNKNDYYETWQYLIKKLGHINRIHFQKNEITLQGYSALVGTDEIFIPYEIKNSEEEISKIKEELDYLKGFLNSVNKKLENEKFVANAKPDIIEKERQKKADAEEKIRIIESKINS